MVVSAGETTVCHTKTTLETVWLILTGYSSLRIKDKNKFGNELQTGTK